MKTNNQYHNLEADFPEFSIFDHVESLTPAKGKNKYICPVCGGNDLGIDPNTGAYSCFHGCKVKDIRDAIAPLTPSDFNPLRQQEQKAKREERERKKQERLSKLSTVEERDRDIQLILDQLTLTDSDRHLINQRGLDDSAIDLIGYQSVSKWQSIEGEFRYNALNSQGKLKNPCDGILCPVRNVHGKLIGLRLHNPDSANNDQPKYLFFEDPHLQTGELPIAVFGQDLARGTVGITEGMEFKPAIASMRLGIPVIGANGVGHAASPKQLKEALEALGANQVILYPDGGMLDNKGVINAYRKTFELLQSWGYVIQIAWWGQVEKANGDIDEIGQDAIANIEYLTIEEFLDLCSSSEPKSSQSQGKTKNETESTNRFESSDVQFNGLNGKTIYVVVEEALYSEGNWIAFGKTLYRWEGTHYQFRPDEREYQRIKEFLQNVPKKNGENKEDTYPYATLGYLRSSLEWVKHGCSVTTEQVNPPGINCTNGVLELRWEEQRLIPELVTHNPTKHFYLSEPKATYNPSANKSEYERLMECLDASSREIWERTIAASIDLPTVRKWKGRAVRALFLKGDGSNGKDTLRFVTELALGNGAIANCSVTDFSQYDQGRNFPVYPLRGKQVNWPSENADVGRVDKLNGLKAAITGDPITFEAKNRDGFQEPCKAVFLFNVNETPNLVATIKATESRWGFVPFNKTYSLNPREGELEADPRFKEDPSFVQNEILPAFLNRLIEQLQTVVLEGIDYSPTQSTFEEMQRESSHLLQFAHETGLQYDPNGSVTVAELWKELKAWYQGNGTLTIEPSKTPKGKERLVWTDQVRVGDKNVKGQNQVVQRFLEVFPKAKRGTRREPGENYSETILTGIRFCPEIAQRAQRAQHDPDEERISARWAVWNCPTSDPQLPNVTNGQGERLNGFKEEDIDDCDEF